MKVGDLVKLKRWINNGQTGIILGFDDCGAELLLNDSSICYVHVRNIQVMK